MKMTNITYLRFLCLQNISLSVNDLLSCCGFMCGDGCDGGYPIRAWRYFVENGVVTDEVIDDNIVNPTLANFLQIMQFLLCFIYVKVPLGISSG